MIKIKNIILEIQEKTRRYSATEKKAVGLLKTEFNKSYREFRKGHKFYRIADIPRAFKDNEYFYIDLGIRERRSKDTSNFYTTLVSMLPSWKAYPKRTRSIICSYNGTPSSDYGTDLFVVLPNNRVKIAVFSGSDFWQSGPLLFNRIHLRMARFTTTFPETLMDMINVTYPSIDDREYPEKEMLSYWYVEKVSQITESTYSKFINDMNILLTKEKVAQCNPITLKSNKRILDDIKIHFDGDWEKYLSDLLDPVGNGVTLVTLDDLDSLGSNKECWFDSPGTNVKKTFKIRTICSGSYMIKIKDVLNESLLMNESVFTRGAFKAIFFAGIPGSGKSYTISKISSGGIEPRIVNFDKYAEYLTSKYKPGFNAGDLSKVFIDKSKQMTLDQLSLYINSMLPLFIDSTSNKANRTLMRNGILKSFGYDTGMIWINTSLKTSLERAKQRDRSVPDEFIIDVYNSIQENITYYRREFSNFFIEIKNDEGELTNETLTKAFVKVSSFFDDSIKNPIGTRNYELSNNGNGYLVPSVYKDISKIKLKLMNWY